MALRMFVRNNNTGAPAPLLAAAPAGEHSPSHWWRLQQAKKVWLRIKLTSMSSADMKALGESSPRARPLLLD